MTSKVGEPTGDHLSVIERPRISCWVWQPWYAKLWWALIVVYWILGVGALWFRPLAKFYTSSLGSSLHIVLYPVSAFLILSIGWLKAWMDVLDYAEAHPEATNNLGWASSVEDDDPHSEVMRSLHDPNNMYSPLSGTMFIGNSENPLHHFHA